jgi:pyruvyl transferase EpsO
MDSADVHDWPSLEKDPLCWLYYRKLWKSGNTLGRYAGLRPLSRMTLKLSDWYFHGYCRKQFIKEGVHFVSRYKNVYTTRLHVGILSILLDKDVTILANSYGKNATFFNTWLCDTDGVKLWEKQ